MQRLAEQKIHIRPRAWGLGFIAVAIVMLLAAINYGNNLIFLLTFVLMALMVNSLWQTRRFLKQINIEPLAIEPRLADTPGWFSVRVSSASGHPAFYIEAIEHEHTSSKSDPYHPHESEHRGVDLTLAKGEETVVELLIASQQRGFLRAPNIEISSHYPFGLFTAWRMITPQQGQWLLPKDRPARLQQDKPDAADTGDQRAEQGDPTRLRAYQPGDSIRHIVFRHYAKTGVLITRQPESEKQPDIPHILDYHQLEGDVHARVEQLAGLVRKLSAARQSWVLYLPNHAPVSADAGQNSAASTEEALRLLARYGLAKDADGFDLHSTMSS